MIGEATVLGTRMIIDTFKNHGVSVTEFYAAGGIAEKNPFIMQVYADIIKYGDKNFRITAGTCALLGSAMFGAVAAGMILEVIPRLSKPQLQWAKLRTIPMFPFRPMSLSITGCMLNTDIARLFWQGSE
ncbi:MAG: FGGY-family carbohydrate kinase [Bacteroidales bacterium]